MPPMSFAKREWNEVNSLRIAIDWTKRARELAILAGIALFLAVLRPYGTGENMPFGLVFAFWMSLILIGSVVGEASVWAFYRVWETGPAWAMILITSLTTTAAVTACLIALQVASGGYISVGGMPDLMLYVWVISVAMTLLGYTLSRAFNAAGPDFVHQADDRAAAAQFLERLPVRFRTAELWAISSEDHYCRVHTSLGSELVLLRLSDAERELSSVDGLRVHRSWWVSRKGIMDARREAGRTVLILASGDEVPVSRSYQDAVKHAGLSP